MARIRGVLRKTVLPFLLSGLLAACSSGPLFYGDDLYVPDDDPNADEKTAFYQSVAGEGDFVYVPSDDGYGPEPVIFGDPDIPIRKFPGEDRMLVNLDGILWRYHAETGNLTCLCTDPVCIHGTGSCPFAMTLSGGHYYDGSVFYETIRFKDGNDYKIYCAYDFTKQKSRELRTGEFGRGIITQVYYDDFCYYYQYEDVAGKKEPDVVLYRQNLSTLKIEEYERYPSYQWCILFAENDRMYYTSIGDSRIYTAPIDDPSAKTPVSPIRLDRNRNMYRDENTMYFISAEETGELVSLNLLTGEAASLKISGADSFVMTEKYVYYLPDEPHVVMVEDVPEALSARNLHRVDRTTGEDTVCYTFDERFGMVSVYDYFVNGRYLYASVMDYANVMTCTLNTTHILRIDMETGETRWIYGK